MQEYEKWKADTQNGRGWTSKYYKGLGTSTAKEAKEYFKAIDDHRLTFRWQHERDHEAIDLAFNKKRADDRKEWMNNYVEGETVDHSKAAVSYSDFVNKELVCFAKYDVMRAIPSMVDGFKPSQRKVLFSAFKRNLKSDVKVAQFAGYIAEHSAYHHGEASLQGTIIGMAQDFVGSNNINLFFPSGQFGTRLMGGKDAASPRYIYTRLERIARTIFHPDDDALLEYQNEEGQSIEPKWYMPVIPMALINGAEGIGTGWSTSVPNYNPRDIIRLLKRIIKKQSLDKESLCPWYRGFKGSIMINDNSESSSYEVVGLASKTGSNSIDITELPVKRWTQDYKEFLVKLADGGDDGNQARIDDIREYHTENSVHFTITGSADQMKALVNEGLEKSLKLRSTISITNMMFFDKEGKIKRYGSEMELLFEFATLRVEYYQKRKDFLVDRLRREKELLDAKVKFILLVIRNELVVGNRKKSELLVDLKQRGFKSQQHIMGKSGSDEDIDKGNGYDYLLGMPIWSLTYERVEELKRQSNEKTAELNNLEKMTIEDLWIRDLDAILLELDAIDDVERLKQQDEQRLKSGKRLRPTAGGARGRGRGRGRGKQSAVDGDGGGDAEEDEAETDGDEDAPPPPSKRQKAEESPAELVARLKEQQKLRAK